MATRGSEPGFGPVGPIKPSSKKPQPNGNKNPAYKVVKTNGYPGQYQADKDFQLKVWKDVGPETRKPDVYQQTVYGDKKKAEGR
jgi:hypothetical protein